MNYFFSIIFAFPITLLSLAGSAESQEVPSHRAEEIQYTPPYFNSLTNLDDFKIKNTNQDFIVWDIIDGQCVLIDNPTETMNDWLISPAMNLEAGRNYTFSCAVKAYNPTRIGKIEVGYGTYQDETSMTEICSLTEITGDEFQKITCQIIPEVSGNYYIGIHGCSDAGESGLVVKNFMINPEETVDNIRTSFEDGESFSMEYGDWTFIDVDESPVGYIIGNNIPNIEPGVTKASFFVFDTSIDNIDFSSNVHHGNKFLASLYRDDNGQVDDWAISPQLSGVSMTVSFWAKSFDYRSPEIIEIYYSTNSIDSTNSINLSDFHKIGTAIVMNNPDWTNYEFNVPAGTKYFAIRSCATGSFMLMLDDFSCRNAGQEVESTPFIHSLNTKDNFTVIDANGDGVYWKFYDTMGAWIDASTSENPKAMDDWIISPPIRLEAGKTYRFSCKTWGKSNTYKEKIEVKYGYLASVSGMSSSLVEETILDVEGNENNFVELEGYITPDYTDNFYIGIHGKSDPNQNTLFVKDFSLTEYPGKPSAPTNILITETDTPGEVTISWTPVITDEYGASIDTSTVHYMVAEKTESGYSPIADNLTDPSLTFRAVEEGRQKFTQYAVYAVTENGESSTMTEKILIGTPYKGINESFADGEFHFAWETDLSLQEELWRAYTDNNNFNVSSCDEDNGFVGMVGRKTDDTASLISGKISLEGMENPGVSFYTYNMERENPDYSKIQLYVKETGSDEWVEIGTPLLIDDLNPGSMGWQKAVVYLEGYKNKVIQIRFQGIANENKLILIDKIVIGNQQPAIPNSVTDLEVDFPQNSLTGTISFYVPWTLLNGVIGNGNLEYSITCEGYPEVIKGGSTSYGIQDTVPITLPQSGKYRFYVTLKNGYGESLSKKISAVIGNQDLPTLKGCVVSSDRWYENPSEDNPVIGIYDVSDAETKLNFEGPTSNLGGIALDGVYYSFEAKYDNGEEYLKNCAYNLESGEKITESPGSYDNLFLGGLTVDPTTRKVYGIAFKGEDAGFQLCEVTINKDASVIVNTIAPLDGYWNSIVCTPQGQLYGISYEVEEVDGMSIVTKSHLQKIDKSTGETTIIGETERAPQLRASSSAIIDYRSGRMFWNLYTSDKKGYLCEIDLKTGEAFNIFRYNGNCQTMGLYIEYPYIPLELDRKNRYLFIQELPEEATIYWTDTDGMPDRLWGEDDNFYTGTYGDISGTFLRMSGTHTIRVKAIGNGLTYSKIVSDDFSEDLISVEEPVINFSDDKLSIERDLTTWCVLATVHDIDFDFNGDRTNPATWILGTKYAVFPPDSIATYNLKVDTEGLWKEDDTYLSLQNMQCDTVKGKLPVHVLTFHTRPGQTIDPSIINPLTLQDIADDVTTNVREYGKAPIPELKVKYITLNDITPNLPDGTTIVLSTIAMAPDGSGQVLSEKTETLDPGFIKNLEEYNYKFNAMALAPNCISSLPSDTIYFFVANHKLQTPILKFDGMKLYAQIDPQNPSTSLFRIKKDVLSDEMIEEQIPNSSVTNGFGYKDGLTFGKYAAYSQDSENHYFPSRKSDPIEIHSIYHKEDETTHYLILDGLEPLNNLFNIPGMPKAKDLKGTLVIMDSISKGHMDYLADSIVNITKLDLESVEWPNNSYTGGRIPNSVRTVRFGDAVADLKNLPESPNVMEIEWTSYKRSIPPRDVSFGDNNHILRVPTNYEGSLKYSPSWGHVVKGLDSNNLEMDSITFFDSKAFYNSEKFTADRAIYARKFAKETPNPYDPNPDKCAGWETIILPFAVDTVVSGKQGFTPFGVGDNKAPHFWLYEASEDGWKFTTDIKAGVPYLISFPLNEEYLKETMHNPDADVLFIGNDVNVIATANKDNEYGLPSGVSFAGNFLLDSDNTMLALNETELEGKPAGSWFFPDTPVYPFRAGIKGGNGQRMPVFGDWGQSGIQTLPDTPKNGMTVDAEGQRIVVRSLVDSTVDVFDLTGALVERLKVHAGEPTYTRTLAPGIYIAAGRKLLIR